jgi:beta-lactamase regulating signal transducer with metallopeptidase domain
MTLPSAVEAFTSLLAYVVNPAARALALGCAAGLGLALFRVKTTCARLFTWTAVLYAAIAMPFLERMLPPLPVPTPSFLQHGVEQPGAKEVSTPVAAAPVRSAMAEVSVVRDYNEGIQGRSSVQMIRQTSSSSPANRKAPRMETTLVVEPATRPRSLWSSIPWSTVAAGIYLSVACILLVRFLVGVAFSRRLMRASTTIDEPHLTQRMAARAYALRLRFTPRVAESTFISVPVTMGALRSTILLPTGWREWDDAKLNAVLAHEMSHVARRDGLTQRLSLLHRAIFWFNPLAWWLDRRLGDLAEQASDEAALSCGADCKDYARTLLSFFEALQAAPGRVWWQGVSMAKRGQAEQRVERILAWEGSVAMSLKKSIAVLVVILAVPVVYLAASVRPANHNAGSQDQITLPPPPRAASAPKAQTDIPPAPALAPTPEMTPPAEPASQPDPALAPSAAAMAPIAAAPPVPPVGRPGYYSQGYSYAYGDDDDLRFVIASGKTDSLTMSGSVDDARMVEKLRKTIPGDFIWFERDDKDYIIRDQATIDRARKFWAPQEELGKKQEELGKQQEALGKQQEELGGKMEQVRVKVPDMTAELDKLKAELKALNSGATMEQVGEIQSEIGDLQSKIGDLQSQAGDQQSKVGEQMSALGEKQGKLGAQQGELGRQQGELARQANRQMKQLLDEAITKGTATPLKQSPASL